MVNQTCLERYIERFPKSRSLYEKANAIFVRGVTHDNRFRPPFPIFVTHAKGSHEWDADGYEYIDYYGGHGGILLGHAHPALVEAVNEQILNGTQYGTSHALEIEWAELIRRLFPSVERVEFTSSGTEANMLGVRLARAFTGREKIVKFQGHFFGFYDPLLKGMAKPWDIPPSAGIPAGHLEKVIVLPINDEEALERTLSQRDVAAVFIEPLGCHSGITGIKPSFHQALRDMTKQHGTLLLFDEVVTGFRCAPGGMQTVLGITPDLTSLGKDLSGGLPGSGAICGRAEVMDMFNFKDPEWDRYRRVNHNGTFNGNPLCSAAGIAALKIFTTGEPQRNANDSALKIRQGLEQAVKERKLNACAYGEYSIFRMFFGDCPMRKACDRNACLNAEKIAMDVGFLPLMNLALNGILAAPTARGFVSAVHTDEDVVKTIDAFCVTLDAMISEGVLKQG